MIIARHRSYFGADYRPTQVHHRDGHWFMVEEILCHRKGADDHTATVGDCWRMRVWGPLPGAPDHRGAFTMVARNTGDPYWWSLTPGPETCECTHAEPHVDRGTVSRPTRH